MNKRYCSVVKRTQSKTCSIQKIFWNLHIGQFQTHSAWHMKVITTVLTFQVSGHDLTQLLWNRAFISLMPLLFGIPDSPNDIMSDGNSCRYLILKSILLLRLYYMNFSEICLRHYVVKTYMEHILYVGDDFQTNFVLVTS